MSKEFIVKRCTRRAAAIKASGKIKENLDQVSRWEAREKEEMNKKKIAVSNSEKGYSEGNANARYARKRRGAEEAATTTAKGICRVFRTYDHHDFSLKFDDFSSASGRSSSTTFLSSSAVNFDDWSGVSSTSSTTFVPSSTFTDDDARDNNFADTEEQKMISEMERLEEEIQLDRRLRAQARNRHTENGKMHLSRRLSRNIRKESRNEPFSSPISPLAAVTLNFTPATSLPIVSSKRPKTTRVAPVTSKYWSKAGPPQTTDIFW
mmetsp:Transcript_16441/g.25089  ORF Transcript_16441/g.25089 Transcript_16441/m.25089 type:complete len:264 (+) Transcript_16441:310-1101(+)